jgi:hypothetical protein
MLSLSESLFTGDAVILDRINSFSARYAVGRDASTGPYAARRS